MKQKMRFTIAAFCMLCAAYMARGSGAISGPDTVCVGSTANYSVIPAPYIHYLWNVTSAGVITSPVTPYPGVTVLWGATGTAVLTVEEIDTLGDTVGTLTLPVYIEPLPAPVIWANVMVGCSSLDDSANQNKQHSQHILSDSSGCVQVCQGSVVTYTAIGNSGDVFGWTIVGGSILAVGADTCMVLWGPAGAGSVSVSDTSVYGCVGAKSVCIDILAKPHAHFYAMPDTSSDTVTLCLDNSAVFVDNSYASTGSPIVNWFWSFGDGSYFTSATSTTQTHEYTTSGVDTAMLVVRNACGCTDTFRMIVVINDSSGVTIVCPHVMCENDTSTYYLSPTPSCTSYNWAVDGGTIIANNDSNITVKWDSVDTSGFGYVIFYDTACSVACPGITVVKVPVVQDTGHISGPLVDCDHSQYLYTMPEWPTTVFNWTISGTTSAYLAHDDQNNHIVINTSGPGIIYLQCNYNNTLLGCGGVAFDTITVLASDSLTGPAQACLYDTSGTYKVGGGLNTNWTLTDPSGYTYPVVTGTSYTTPVLNMTGAWVLTVTPGTGATYCPIAPFIITVEPLPPPPDSMVGPDTTCYGTPATYTAYSALPGYIFEWGAVTGTCNAAEGDNSAITFTGAGPDTAEVWRVAQNAPHCHSDTVRKVVYPPYVHLNITGLTSVCPSSIAHYDAGYYDGETYTWTVITNLLGSVQVNGLDTADVLWNNTPGPAKVVLAVVKCGNTYRDTLDVTIIGIPALGITINPNPVCAGQPFTASVTGSGGGGVSWNWDDGSAPGSGATTTHIFADFPGTATFVHHVAVTVTDPYGCIFTESDTISVSELPAPEVNVSPAGPISSCTPPSGFPITATLTIGFEPTDSLIWVNTATGDVDSCGPPPTCYTYLVNGYGSYYVIAVGANGCKAVSNTVLFDTCVNDTTTCVLHPKGWALIDTTSQNCGVVYLGAIYAGSPLTAFSWSWNPLPGGATLISSTSTTLECSFGMAGNYEFSYTVGFVDPLHDTCYVTYDTNVLVPFIAGMGHSVSCVGGTYTVSLDDQSNYYPGYPPDSFSWYVNGGYVTTTSTAPYTLPLAAGHGYTLGVWEYYGTGDSCYAADTVYLDTLPVASFSFARDTTCAVDASVQFTNLTTPTSGLSYLWNFDDGSYNSEEDPYRVYAGGTFVYTVSLTVTNEYGCTDSVKELVPIKARDLFGTLTGGGTFCQGTPVLLFFHSTGSGNPDDYYWMEGTDTMYMSTINTTYVYNSGSYWVTVTDTFGCYSSTNATPAIVNIIKVPPAVITGNHYACLDVPYTLNGWVGDDTNVSYKWYKNNVLVGTGSSYTDPAATVTSVPDTFMLVVFIAYGTDTCSDTSVLFTVTVYPPPPAPSIIPMAINCNSYTIQLTALGPPYGTYDWSNGMSGQVIDITPAGGPYRVWYTDTFGCESYGDFYVAKDPRSYMGTFPSGCFTFCDTSLYLRYITGPLYEYFDYWAYQYAPLGPVIKSGGGFVDTMAIPGPGDYDMILQNDYCRDTSDIMDVTVVHCAAKANCKCIKSQQLTGYTTQCNPPTPGCCMWKISLCVNNNCEERLNATITVSGGTVTPPAIVIPPGTSCDTFAYNPSGPFDGGWVYFTISWSDATGSYECPDSVYMPPCGEGGGGHRNGQGAVQPAGGGYVMLNLVPNPAQNTVRMDFATGSNTGATLEVYDMTGRTISSYHATVNEGSWYLDLDSYPAGVYIVTLKDNSGAVLKQSKLSIVR